VILRVLLWRRLPDHSVAAILAGFRDQVFS